MFDWVGMDSIYYVHTCMYIYICIYCLYIVYIVSFYLCVPDEGNLLPKYRVYIYNIYIYIYIYI